VTASGSSGLPIDGHCLILSEGGLDAILPEHLSLGKTVYLELAPALRVYAAVRNRRSFRYGLEFMQVKDVERVAIKQLCDYYRELYQRTRTQHPSPSPESPN
jgi:hypothetical protein